jgi:hypothetical protein
MGRIRLVQWLGEGWGLDRLDAYQLLTQAAEAPVANVVDPNYTFVSKLRNDRPERRGPGPRGQHGAAPRLDRRAGVDRLTTGGRPLRWR